MKRTCPYCGVELTSPRQRKTCGSRRCMSRRRVEWMRRKRALAKMTPEQRREALRVPEQHTCQVCDKPLDDGQFATCGSADCSYVWAERVRLAGNALRGKRKRKRKNVMPETADTKKGKFRCLGCGKRMWTDRCHRICSACHRRDANRVEQGMAGIPHGVVLPGGYSPQEVAGLTIDAYDLIGAEA